MPQARQSDQKPARKPAAAKSRPRRKAPASPLKTNSTAIAGVFKHLRISIDQAGTWSHPPGYNHPPRIDSRALLMLVVTGTAEMFVGKDAFRIRPGDLLFQPRKAALHYRVGPGAPFLHKTLHFTVDDGAGAHLENLSLVPKCTRLGSLREVAGIFDRICTIIASPQPSAYFECVSLLFGLLSRMSNAGEDHVSPGSVKLNKAHLALHIIEEKFTEKLSVDHIARQLGVTPEYLSVIFRDTFGITPKTQIRNFRMQRAGDLLLTSDLSVKEVAFAVGYESVNTFDRAFQQLFHKTPSEFRRSRSIQTVSGPQMPYRKK
jgi:AraC-like DNA-binding protein